MKKNIFLLLASSLLSIGTTQAVTKNITKCYGNKLTMEASTTGNSYQWYENGTKINGATNKTYTVNSVTANAKYECKITTNGGSRTTNFLKSTNGTDYGDFEFPASQATSWDQYKKEFPVRDEIRNETYTARIELKKFMQDGVCDAGESTTTQNPNDIKPDWFNSIGAYQNNYMLAVDGPAANAGAFDFFEVYNLNLKAGQEYEFSCYIINIDKKYTPGGNRSLPQLQFKLVKSDNSVLHSGNLFTIDPSLTKWGKYEVTYTPSQDLQYVKLIISNQTQGQDGNDFAIDGVYFGAKQNSASTTTTDVFNLTVYDTFTYKFETTPVCPGAEATITTTLVPAHNGTLDPNITKEWIKYSDRSFASDKQNLVVTAPNAVGPVTYELTSKGQYCGNLSQTTSITVIDCGREVPINHPAVTYCTKQNVTLKCDKTGSSVKWDHDTSLTSTEITVVSNSAVNKDDTYKCTITTTENGNTITYIETFTVKTKDCSILVESTMCNTSADSTLKASKTGTNYEYHWTLPNGDTRTTETDTIKIKHTNATVGETFEYSCEIYEYKASPTPSAPTLANNIIENGGFEDVTLVGGEYKGFTSDYEFHTVDQGFNYGKSGRGFMQVSSKESYGITPASGNYMYECDGDDKVNKNRAWIASTDKNPRLKITKDTQYQFSYKAAMQGTTNNPKLTFYIEFNGKKEKLLDTQTLPADSKWHTYGEGIYWTAPEDCNNVTLSLVDDCFKNAGNDFCLDDIMFQPLQNGSSSSTQPTLIAIENFEITITNCYTQATNREQVREDGSITIEVPGENRCMNCTYRWYKIDTNGNITVLQDSEIPTYTYNNAKDGEIFCDVKDDQERISHTQKYIIVTYKPEPESICYDTELTKTLEGETSETDNYEWYWLKNDTEVEFPAEAITIEGNKATLNLEYFVKQTNSTEPIVVNVLQKYEVEVEVSTTEGSNNEGGEENEEEGESDDTGTHRLAQIDELEIYFEQKVTDISSVNDTKKILISDNGTLEEYDDTYFKISDSYIYQDPFGSKVGNMDSHEGHLKFTDTPMNAPQAYTGDRADNKYFVEVDGGDTAGPVFSIIANGKISKGDKYILSFLATDTSGYPTESPADIQFTININNSDDIDLTPRLLIDHNGWKRYTYPFEVPLDGEEVIITLSNYNTSSGQNDFAIDEITFTLDKTTDLIPDVALPEDRSLKLRNSELRNSEFQMWRKEFSIIINQVTSESIIETAGLNKEYEKEVELPNETITFIYDPNTSQVNGRTYQDYKVSTNQYGCEHHVYFTLNLVSIEPMIFFSPNNDGLNDLWLVKGIESAPDAYIMIYDRYSKLLYKCKGSEFTGWDGNYNGHGMVQDDYWYVISIPETEEQISGHFTLKR